MTIEKVLDIQNIQNIKNIKNPQEFIDTVLNLLDIKINKASNEKINAILDKIFEFLNNQPKTFKENLENRFVEKLNFEFLKKTDKKDFQNKLDFGSNQNLQEIDKIKIDKAANDLKNDFFKNESFQNPKKVSLNRDLSNDQNVKIEKKIEKLHFQFLENLLSKSLDKKGVLKDKLTHFLNCVKKALDNFKIEDKSFLYLKSSESSNKELLNPSEKTIKIDFKLFSLKSLKILQEQNLLIQNRQNLIPMDIVGYHIKEKDKEINFVKSKKKKKHRPPKQMKYKENDLD